MILTEWVNHLAVGLTGLTEAGTALSVAIVGWVMFWTRTAKLIPTEWSNPYIASFFQSLNLVCRILGLDFPDIAQIDWKHFRIVTKSELTASKIVEAKVVPEAVIDNPPPPAAPDSEVKPA